MNIVKKLRYMAYRKGLADGNKWQWKRRTEPGIPLGDYYKPPFWFKEWYGSGFDVGAGLEVG